VVFDEENNKRLRSLEYQYAKAFGFIVVSMTVADVPVKMNPLMTHGIIWIATLHLTSNKGVVRRMSFLQIAGIMKKQKVPKPKDTKIPVMVKWIQQRSSSCY